MKKIYIPVISFLLGIAVYAIMMIDAPNRKFIQRAKEYSRKIADISDERLKDPHTRNIIRVEFSGGLEKGGIEVDLDKKTGKLLNIRH